MLKRVRSSAGIAAHSMPPIAPATNIAGSTSAALAAVKRERDAAREDRAEDELALGADVPDVGPKADTRGPRAISISGDAFSSSSVSRRESLIGLMKKV